MKIISLLASPHGLKGNTAGLLALVVEGAESAGAENETVVLPGNTVLPCMACQTCHIKGVCPQKDEFETIRGKIMAADGLILASPNYMSSVSAQLKAFLDRCCGVVHCQSFTGKYGAVAITSGSGDEAPIAAYLSRFLANTGTVPVGEVWATMRALPGGAFPAPLRDKALALGGDLVAAWKEGRGMGPWAEASNSFRKRMKGLVMWKKNEWLFEYEFWKNHLGLI
ncbi:MAG: flavodoxin family protein [Thermodesulfobacteriota bacterium]